MKRKIVYLLSALLLCSTTTYAESTYSTYQFCEFCIDVPDTWEMEYSEDDGWTSFYVTDEGDESIAVLAQWADTVSYVPSSSDSVYAYFDYLFKSYISTYSNDLVYDGEYVDFDVSGYFARGYGGTATNGKYVSYFIVAGNHGALAINGIGYGDEYANGFTELVTSIRVLEDGVETAKQASGITK